MPNFTREAIKQTFLKLLNERSVSKITVKDIVTECGINRNSFYYHFSDLPALIEALLLEEADRIIAENASLESFEDCIMSTVPMAISNKNAVIHLYQADREMYEQYLERIAEHVIRSYINTVIHDIDWQSEDIEIIISYYKCLLIGFVLDWMNSGMKYDIRTKIKRVCELFDGSLSGAISRAAESARH